MSMVNMKNNKEWYCITKKLIEWKNEKVKFRIKQESREKGT